jgi:hypothetical protein
MKLSDELPLDDSFDQTLAIECGITDDQLLFGRLYEAPLDRFMYVQDMWECSGCGLVENFDDGPKYYYNPETNNYNAPKPLTLKEQAEAERLAQEAAGQMRLML